MAIIPLWLRPQGSGLSLYWAKIDACIRIYRNAHTILDYSPLLINMSLGKAYMENREISLTPLEFNMLSLSASSPSTVFTAKEFFSHLWGNPPACQNHVVQVTMSRLRSKLGKAFSGHYFIETIWGMGYQFIPPNVPPIFDSKLSNRD